MTKFYITLTMLCLLALPALGQSSLSPAHGYDVATWLPDFPNIGAFDFSATNLSKGNMFIQISFCVLVLLSQVIAGIPPVAIFAGTAAVLFIAAASGFDYVMSWTIKAIQSRKTSE